VPNWNSFESGNVGPLEFLPGGVFSVMGMEMGQKNALANSTFGDVTIDKPAGEAEVMTCRFPDGRTYHFKYESGSWWTDMPPPDDARREGEETQAAPQPAVVPTRASVGRSPHYWLVLAAAALVIVLLSLYLVPSALREAGYVLQGGQTQAETPRSEASRKEAALKEELLTLQAAAAEKAHRLSTQSEALRGRVVETVGINLEGLGDSPQSRPRELDLAILKDDSVARSWAAVRNAYVSSAEISERKTRLTAIEARLREAGPAADDRIVIGDITSWLDSKMKALTGQDQNLDNLRTALEAARFEERNKERP